MSIPEYPIVVVVFGMEGCPACASYIPKFREVARAWQGRVPAFVVDANQQPAAADFYGITDTPTTLVLRYGAKLGHPLVGAADLNEINDVFRLASTWV